MGRTCFELLFFLKIQKTIFLQIFPKRVRNIKMVTFPVKLKYKNYKKKIIRKIIAIIKKFISFLFPPKKCVLLPREKPWKRSFSMKQKKTGKICRIQKIQDSGCQLKCVKFGWEGSKTATNWGVKMGEFGKIDKKSIIDWFGGCDEEGEKSGEKLFKKRETRKKKTEKMARNYTEWTVCEGRQILEKPREHRDWWERIGVFLKVFGIILDSLKIPKM